jgi:hypothetical protein
MATPFELFCSAEIPKRIGTNTDPLTVPAGQVPVTTGVGLLTEFQPYSGGSGVPTVSITAAENIGGHRAVLASGLYADNGTLPNSIVIGISTGAVSSGGQITCQVAGEMTEVSWTWDTSKPVYLGSAGLLTQTVPTAGVIVEIGKPTAATKLLIEIQPPIQLAEQGD